MYGYIYKCTYLKNNKIYIGAKSSPTFVKNYYGSGGLWNKEVVSKCDPEVDIKREVLEWCETYEQLNQQEQYWIKYYDSTNPEVGYNVQKGGSLLSEEARKKISITTRARMTAEHRHHISEKLKQYRRDHDGLSTMHRKHLSRALKGRKVGGDGDSRSIQVSCIVDGNTYSFHNKIQAAKWWFDNYPFSDKYAEITYTRAITKSINHIEVKYKKKPINQNIQWFLSHVEKDDISSVYCIYNETQYEFDNIHDAIIWWHSNYPIMKELNFKVYQEKLIKNINGFAILRNSVKYDKIQWFRKE